MLVLMGFSILVALLAILAIGVLLFWYLLRASLPGLDGAHFDPALTGSVLLERDAMGVLTVTGTSACDRAFALGFAHAQDRRFQMDLLRRVSAGELSALLGRATLESDRNLRAHRFRQVARAALASLPPEEVNILESYAAGVNAATSQLKVRPFEYLILRVAPELWKPEDCILVNLTLFVALQSADAVVKIQRGLIESALPSAAADFIYGSATAFEAPIDGSAANAPQPPLAAVYDLKQLGGLNFNPPTSNANPTPMAGSNNWAVSGERTRTGAALVANDMHLALSVPNIWYRARLRVNPGSSQVLDVTGATLPGAPAIVVGSNGHIAWSLTNSYGDFQEVVIAVPDPLDLNKYLTPDGSLSFSRAVEQIEIKGENPVSLELLSTKWGPVIGCDSSGRKLSLEWTAHKPEAVQMGVRALETTTSVSEALNIATRAGIPGLNFVVGDDKGNIGWTLMGRIPKWKSRSHAIPRLSTDPLAGFEGLLPSQDHPRIENPPSGQIVTANNRLLGGEGLTVIGDNGYNLGVRAQQISDGIAGRFDLTESEMLELQLDDAAKLLSSWHNRLTSLLDDQAIAGHPLRAELRDLLHSWTGHAAVDDAAYTFVRAFRLEMLQRAFFALIAPARAQSPDFKFMPPESFEGPLTTLLDQQPEHLLPPGFVDWREFQLSAVDEVLKASRRAKLSERKWGRVNLVRIRHPLSAAIPFLGWLLDMPAQEMPGDSDMPRVSCAELGASERFAVSPGREADAYFTMPGGQSGHPLSKYYRAGHRAWVRGEHKPFLPGNPEHVLELKPKIQQVD